MTHEEGSKYDKKKKEVMNDRIEDAYYPVPSPLICYIPDRYQIWDSNKTICYISGKNKKNLEFKVKLYWILSLESWQHILKWSDDGRSFIIFEDHKHTLSKSWYYQHFAVSSKDYKSFLKLLNNYNFHLNIPGTQSGYYMHLAGPEGMSVIQATERNLPIISYFINGSPELLCFIVKPKKEVKQSSTSGKVIVGPRGEEDNDNDEDENYNGEELKTIEEEYNSDIQGENVLTSRQVDLVGSYNNSNNSIMSTHERQYEVLFDEHAHLDNMHYNPQSLAIQNESQQSNKFNFNFSGLKDSHHSVPVMSPPPLRRTVSAEIMSQMTGICSNNSEIEGLQSLFSSPILNLNETGRSPFSNTIKDNNSPFSSPSKQRTEIILSFDDLDELLSAATSPTTDYVNNSFSYISNSGEFDASNISLSSTSRDSVDHPLPTNFRSMPVCPSKIPKRNERSSPSCGVYDEDEINTSTESCKSSRSIIYSPQLLRLKTERLQQILPYRNTYSPSCNSSKYETNCSNNLGNEYSI
jgi:hypothetical protein